MGRLRDAIKNGSRRAAELMPLRADRREWSAPTLSETRVDPWRQEALADTMLWIAEQVRQESGADRLAVERVAYVRATGQAGIGFSKRRADSVVLYAGAQDAEALAELTGRPGSANRWNGNGRKRPLPTLGSSIEEQRDMLYDFVRVVAAEVRTPIADAPEHRQPEYGVKYSEPVDYRPLGPEEYTEWKWRQVDVEQTRFDAAVNDVWVKGNFDAVVSRLNRNPYLRDRPLIDNKTFSKLMAKAPVERSEHGSVPDAERPAKLELTDREQAVKGFLEDLADRSGVDREVFISGAHNAPHSQQAWQMAGALMSNSRLSSLSDAKYGEVREELSVVVDEQTARLVSGDLPAAEARHEATERVLGALRDLEAEAAPAADVVQEKIVDPRVGVADPGSTAAGQAEGLSEPPAGDGAVPAYRPVQAQSQSPRIG
jgi:hypothetical protein